MSNNDKVIEKFRDYLSKQEQVEWSAKTRRPKENHGCFVALFIFPGILALAMNALHSPIMTIVFTIISLASLAVMLFSPKYAYYLLTDQYLYVKKRLTVIKVPVKHIYRVKQATKRSKDHGDLHVFSKFKQLNAKDFSFNTQEDTHKLPNVPDYAKVAELIVVLRKKLPPLDTSNLDDIEIDGQI